MSAIFVQNSPDDEEDSLYKAKIKNEEIKADAENIKIKSKFDFFKHPDVNHDAKLKAEIEAKIEKYSSKKLITALEKVQNLEDLQKLAGQYEKFLESVEKDMAKGELKSKEHMKEYVAMWSALKSLQTCINKFQDKNFSHKEFQKEFKLNFEKNLVSKENNNKKPAAIDKKAAISLKNNFLSPVFKAANQFAILVNNIAKISNKFVKNEIVVHQKENKSAVEIKENVSKLLNRVQQNYNNPMQSKVQIKQEKLETKVADNAKIAKKESAKIDEKTPKKQSFTERTSTKNVILIKEQKKDLAKQGYHIRKEDMKDEKPCGGPNSPCNRVR